MDTPLLEQNTISHHLPAVSSLMQPFYLKQSLVFIIPGEYIWHLFTVQLLYQPILGKTLVENCEYETHQRSVCTKDLIFQSCVPSVSLCHHWRRYSQKTMFSFLHGKFNTTTWLIFLIKMIIRSQYEGCTRQLHEIFSELVGKFWYVIPEVL